MEDFRAEADNQDMKQIDTTEMKNLEKNMIAWLHLRDQKSKTAESLFHSEAKAPIILSPRGAKSFPSSEKHVRALLSCSLSKKDLVVNTNENLKNKSSPQTPSNNRQKPLKLRNIFSRPKKTNKSKFNRSYKQEQRVRKSLNVNLHVNPLSTFDKDTAASRNTFSPLPSLKIKKSTAPNFDKELETSPTFTRNLWGKLPPRVFRNLQPEQPPKLTSDLQPEIPLQYGTSPQPVTSPENVNRNHQSDITVNPVINNRVDNLLGFDAINIEGAYEPPVELIMPRSRPAVAKKLPMPVSLRKIVLLREHRKKQERRMQECGLIFSKPVAKTLESIVL